ncbi:hypothetical protein KOR34_08280 [Posidoniimonas corsicana]|uniref:LamG-like jellyroll fold domain-containing protein n=1 Tax=Posidoniimonas corsicana TaxID=1938618 RepID=A0A5C5VCD6_9BACT|nr:LamG domain-containing protein [Posidoniimonas corsicana]TWT35931.1 hypothetical protein KOR34_08280 [Posidoniimonas corsicana]
MSRLTHRTWNPAAPALAAVVVAGMCLSPAHGVITHQYLFNSGNGTEVLDSVGSAHGSTHDGVAGMSPFVNTAQSRLTLNGTSSHAQLPAAQIAINTYSALTLEMWMAQTGNVNQFTFAAGFGRTSDGSNGESANLGYDYLMMQPTRGPADQGSRGAISLGTFDGEVGVTDGNRDLNDGGLHHVVMTVTDTELGYYVDGVQIGTAPLSTESGPSLSTVSNDLAYLGRALYPDPYMQGSIYEFSIWDEALSELDVATRFSAGCVDTCGERYLEIDRVTGEATLVNTLANERFYTYTLESAAGALNPVGWNSIADTGDSDSGGSIDPNDVWLETSSLPTNLSENEPIDGGGDDGALMGSGFSLGNIWSKSRFEDLTMQVTILEADLVTERIEPIAVRFVGNNDQPFSRSDLDVDGDIDADDYAALLSNHLTAIPGTTAFETAPFGDLDGDLDNDFNDFRLFKNDFIAANGAEAFAALGATPAPEPTAALLALLALTPAAVRRRS